MNTLPNLPTIILCLLCYLIASGICSLLNEHLKRIEGMSYNYFNASTLYAVWAALGLWL